MQSENLLSALDHAGKTLESFGVRVSLTFMPAESGARPGFCASYGETRYGQSEVGLGATPRAAYLAAVEAYEAKKRERQIEAEVRAEVKARLAA